jgi:hypothetical protein
MATQSTPHLDTRVDADLLDALVTGDVALSASEHIAVGHDPAPGSWADRRRRLADSSVVTGGVTLLASGLLAATVGAAVFGVTGGHGGTGIDRAPAAPLPAAAVAERPSQGDARHGLSADAVSRRSGSVVIDGPSTGDARRGLSADADSLRAAGAGTPSIDAVTGHQRDAASRQLANQREDRGTATTARPSTSTDTASRQRANEREERGTPSTIPR